MFSKLNLRDNQFNFMGNGNATLLLMMIFLIVSCNEKGGDDSTSRST